VSPRDGDGRLQVRADREPLDRVGAAAGALADHGSPAELLEVVAEFLAAGERGAAGQHQDPLVRAEPAAGRERHGPGLRNIRLTADQARELASTLNDLVADLDDAGDGAARYGVLVGLYQPRPPGPDRSSSP
jgi:hypothetical protein